MELVKQFFSMLIETLGKIFVICFLLIGLAAMFVMCIGIFYAMYEGGCSIEAQQFVCKLTK